MRQFEATNEEDLLIGRSWSAGKSARLANAADAQLWLTTGLSPEQAMAWERGKPNAP